MNPPSPFYQHKPDDYCHHVRTNILSFLGDIQGQKIFEIGKSGGNTLAWAKTKGRAAYVAGVDFFDLPNTAQRDSCLDEFHWSDLNLESVTLKCSNFDILALPKYSGASGGPVANPLLMVLFPQTGRIAFDFYPQNKRSICIMENLGAQRFWLLRRWNIEQDTPAVFVRQNAKNLLNCNQYCKIKVIPAKTFQKGPNFVLFSADSP
jgi:hypothetical protein